MIIGLDEAGRGALAGPVVAGAVAFKDQLSKRNCPVFDFIKDSKKLTDTQRREVDAWLEENVAFGVGVVRAQTIDEIGIKAATERAMNEALEKVVRQIGSKANSSGLTACLPAAGLKSLRLLVDGRDKFKFPYPSEDIVKGDEKILEISAASIIAKVTRDDWMIELDVQHPQFGFAQHKGYGAAAHYALLEQGVYCAEHRQSYDPLKTWLHQGKLF